MTKTVRVTPAVANVLKSYVYLYSDPNTGEPFYIGKGKDNRLHAHLDDQSETRKTSRIAQISKSGKEPQIDILRYGLSDVEASLVEAAAIDLLGKSRLTNQMAGYHQQSFGKINSEDIVTLLTAKSVKVKHKAVLITINKLYRSGMTSVELYEATRGIWVIGRRRKEAEYAMSVYQGIVREVYKIEKWHPAGTLKYHTRETTGFKSSGRWEFEGSVADSVRDNYVGFSVGKSGQNPI